MKNNNKKIKEEFIEIQKIIKNLGPPKSDEEIEQYKLILNELNEMQIYLDNIKNNKNNNDEKN